MCTQEWLPKEAVCQVRCRNKSYPDEGSFWEGTCLGIDTMVLDPGHAEESWSSSLRLSLGQELVEGSRKQSYGLCWPACERACQGW